MDSNDGASERRQAQTGRRGWAGRWLAVAGCAVVLCCAVMLLIGEHVLHNAEPILRKRIIETLSARFDAPVELDRISISLLKGIEVEGFGLRIPFGAGRGGATVPYPLVAVRHFVFRMSLRSLLHPTSHVDTVRVDGMEIHIPPPDERKQLLGTKEGTKPADPGDPRLKPKIALAVSELQCTDVKLFIESGKPGKVPLEFDIAALKMRDVGRDQAMVYDALLTNPKPVGVIHATGHFGPWGGVAAAAGKGVAGQPADPGQTPLDGSYSFEHADLNTIKGIGGILSSTGRFGGVLDSITIDGETDVPDFSLDISNRPVPLHTVFHATVDGMSGDTFLNPVHARLEDSDFTVSGKVVKVNHAGHDIALDVDVPRGRMQDFLRLAMKTNPPLLNGVLAMQAKLHIPPGNVRVPEKMAMTGSFQLTGVRFNNPKMQDRIDGLSARAQGKPREVAEVSRDREAEVHSQLAAGFVMSHGVMEVSDVRYAVPGALVLLNGVYSMDGRLFEFKGHVRTDATPSQMVSGWKSWLLKPVDPFLAKNGAGLELPIVFSGTEGDVHVGLALHGTDETPAGMLADVKGKDRDQREMEAARREAAQADSDDAKAARATSLEAAEQAHNAAVRHRAEAQARAQGAQKRTEARDR